MKKQIPPHEYITRVLHEWGEFCKGHKRFEKALIEILEENERLKAEIKQLRKDIKKYERLQSI